MPFGEDLAFLIAMALALDSGGNELTRFKPAFQKGGYVRLGSQPSRWPKFPDLDDGRNFLHEFGISVISEILFPDAICERSEQRPDSILFGQLIALAQRIQRVVAFDNGNRPVETFNTFKWICGVFLFDQEEFGSVSVELHLDATSYPKRFGLLRIAGLSVHACRQGIRKPEEHPRFQSRAHARRRRRIPVPAQMLLPIPAPKLIEVPGLRDKFTMCFHGIRRLR